MITEFEVNYERARENENYRQEFLNSIDMGEYSPFVKEIKYKPNPNSREGEMRIGSFETILFYCGMRPRRSKIIVCPKAFEKPFHDFLNIIVNHEGYHAKQLTEGKLNFFPPILRIRKFESILAELEYEAFINQVHGSTIKNSLKHSLFTIGYAMDYESILENYIK